MAETPEHQESTANSHSNLCAFKQSNTFREELADALCERAYDLRKMHPSVIIAKEENLIKSLLSVADDLRSMTSRESDIGEADKNMEGGEDKNSVDGGAADKNMEGGEDKNSVVRENKNLVDGGAADKSLVGGKDKNLVVRVDKNSVDGGAADKNLEGEEDKNPVVREDKNGVDGDAADVAAATGTREDLEKKEAGENGPDGTVPGEISGHGDADLHAIRRSPPAQPNPDDVAPGQSGVSEVLGAKSGDLLRRIRYIRSRLDRVTSSATTQRAAGRWRPRNVLKSKNWQRLGRRLQSVVSRIGKMLRARKEPGEVTP